MHKRKILFYTLGLGLFLFIVNKIATAMSWYWVIWWFDMPMHFLGGVVCGFLALIFLYPTIRRLMREKKYGTVCLIVLGSVLFLGILWEIYEHFLEKEFSTVKITTPLDTVSDLLFDISGGLALLLFFVVPPKKKVTDDAILSS